MNFKKICQKIFAALLLFDCDFLGEPLKLIVPESKKFQLSLFYVIDLCVKYTFTIQISLIVGTLHYNCIAFYFLYIDTVVSRVQNTLCSFLIFLQFSQKLLPVKEIIECNAEIDMLSTLYNM